MLFSYRASWYFSSPYYSSQTGHLSLTGLLRQSALFNFEALIFVVLLAICTSAYVHELFTGILDSNKDGLVASVTEMSWRGLVLTATGSLGSSGNLIGSASA